MSEYEKLRRKNIEDNKRILAELGLANIVRIIKHLFVIRSRWIIQVFNQNIKEQQLKKMTKCNFIENDCLDLKKKCCLIHLTELLSILVLKLILYKYDQKYTLFLSYPNQRK